MNTYVIKTKPGCPFCDMAKKLLAETGDNILEQSHDTPEAVMAFKRTGFKTFPQIFLNGKIIGGYDELKEFLLVNEEF